MPARAPASSGSRSPASMNSRPAGPPCLTKARGADATHRRVALERETLRVERVRAARAPATGGAPRSPSPDGTPRRARGLCRGLPPPRRGSQMVVLASAPARIGGLHEGSSGWCGPRPNAGSRSFARSCAAYRLISIDPRRRSPARRRARSRALIARCDGERALAAGGITGATIARDDTEVSDVVPRRIPWPGTSQAGQKNRTAAVSVEARRFTKTVRGIRRLGRPHRSRRGPRTTRRPQPFYRLAR